MPMPSPRILLPAVLLAFAAAAQAQAPDPADLLIDNIAAHETLMPNLAQLCDDIGPRMTGTPALRTAQRWAMDKLRAYGAVDVHTETYAMGRPWKRGAASARLLNANGMALDIVQKAWSAPTRGPVTGEVAILDVDSLTGLRTALPALRGKIVLVLSGPKAGSAERQDMARYQRDVNAALAHAGLAGVLLIAGRDEVPDMWGGPGSRFDRQAGIITLRSAAVLQRLLARGITPRLRLELTGGFAPRPQLAHNVVADFKGSEPGAHVIIGAHLDSWDLSCGAADNASGVVAALEVLRAMHSSCLTPRRSLRVVLFSGEEQGLLGSRAYVAAHRAGLADIQAVLVLDGGAGRILAFPDMQVDAWYAPLAAAAALARRVGEPDIVYETGLGSDHEPFFARGIPAFAPLQERRADRRTVRHGPDDVPGHVVAADLLQATQVLAVMAWGLMNGAALPHQ